MKEAYYFSHDSNARHDPKISAMRGVYGAEGYGWYWMIIEMMRDSEGYRLDMQSKYAFNAFALQLQADCSKIEEFIEDCINEFHLFESDGKFFWSNSLLRRMAQREEVRAKRSAAAKARWDKEKSESGKASENAQPMQMHDQSNANAMQGKESKGKESKRNKKEKKICPEPPTAVQDNHPPQKDNKDKYGPENTYYKMAVYFKSKIDEMAAREGLHHLTGKTNLQTWADDFRKLVELDKQSDKDLIRSVMDWVVNDDFWKSNVLSAEKFRKQFPRLVLAMKKKTKSSKVVPIGTSKKPLISIADHPSSGPEVSDAEFEEMMRMAKEMSTSKGGRSHA